MLSKTLILNFYSKNYPSDSHFAVKIRDIGFKIIVIVEIDTCFVT